jgi:hypothetical protein
MTPQREQRPGGLEANDAGERRRLIYRSSGVPVAPRHSRAATAAAEPPRSRRHQRRVGAVFATAT